MKKSILIGFVAIMAVVFSSCNNAPECKFHKDALNLLVMHEDWQFDDDTKQFYFHFDVPEVTNYVYNVGNWSLSREFNEGTKDAYQVSLPTSEFAIDTLWNEEHDAYDLHYFSRYIDYRVGVDMVEVQVTYSDYYYPTDKYGDLMKPEDMLFRLQLIY